MNPRTPALQSLRVFEVAAKHLSFKLAARELNVTPSAISHQIKALEHQLNFSLFRRLNRALQLTAAGEDLLAVVHLHLVQLQRGVDDVIKRHGTPSIRAHLLPFMATEIVIPNLYSFQQAYPEVELRIETSFHSVNDFSLSDCDLSIRLGKGNWPGLCAEKLVGIRVTPVCSPEFQSTHQLHRIEDIQGKTLINLPIEPHPWDRLAEEAGIAPLLPHQELTLDNYLSNLAAAEQSLGIALGLLPIAISWLQKGRLVAPFDLHFEIDQSYWIVYRPEDTGRPEIQLFKSWMLNLFEDLQTRSDELYSSDAQKVSFVGNTKPV